MNNKILLALLVCASFVSCAATAETNRPGNPRGYSPDALLEVFKLTQADSDVPFDSLMQACPARDCIPSIDEPKFVPAGTRITAVGAFDNSPQNPANPDPSIDVSWGQQSWDEMFFGSTRWKNIDQGSD